MKKGGLHHLTQLFNLLLAATDVAVRHIRLLLHLHHGHGRVDLGGQGDVNLVLIAIHTETANTAVFTAPERHHMYNKEHNRDLAHLTLKHTHLDHLTQKHTIIHLDYFTLKHTTHLDHLTLKHSNRDQNHITLKHNRPESPHTETHLDHLRLLHLVYKHTYTNT